MQCALYVASTRLVVSELVATRFVSLQLRTIGFEADVRVVKREFAALVLSSSRTDLEKNLVQSEAPQSLHLHVQKRKLTSSMDVLYKLYAQCKKSCHPEPRKSRCQCA